MPVTRSINNAPDEIVRRLKEQVKKHHRSLQGELLAILEAATGSPSRMTASEAPLAAFALLPRLEIDAVELDHGAALLLAGKAMLGIHDASYLWLAEMLHAELVTLDRR